MKSDYWGRRLRRHVLLAASSLAGVAIVAWMLPEGIRVFRLSMGTAYASLGLLAVSLGIGPWRVLRGRPSPASTDLRRDVGIWAALLAAAHTVLGLQVHLPGKMLQYFLWPPGHQRLVPFRYDFVGMTNFSGLGAMLVLLLLLALSNDAALRRLGSARWKALQRWNYAGFALMAVHGWLYQAAERRGPPWIMLFTGVVVLVIAVQVAGWRRRRRARGEP